MITLRLDLDPGDGSRHTVSVPLHAGYGSDPAAVHELMGAIIGGCEGEPVWVWDAEYQAFPIWREMLRRFAIFAVYPGGGRPPHAG